MNPAEVKTKFIVNYVSAPSHGAVTVQLQAVTQGSKENESFWKMTPSGTITLQITNPDAHVFFVTGKEYYVGFTLSSKDNQSESV
jgi:hypothetical protein